MLILLLCW